MGLGDDLKQAEMKVHMARVANDQARKEAEAAVRRAEKAREARMLDIEKMMRSVKKETARRVASYNGVFLYVDRVVCAGTKLSLDAFLDAKVDVRGGIYPGGCFGTPRDHRKLFILIESPAGTILRECDPDEEKKARDFVTLVNTTAAKVNEVQANARRQLEKLQDELDKEEAKTAEIDAAKAVLEAAKNDTSAVDAAQRAFEEAKLNASKEELTAYNDERNRYGRTILVAVSVAVVVLVAIVVALVFSL